MTTANAERLRHLVAQVLKCNPEDVTDETGPGDLPGWDSLGHVALMAAIHDTFGMHVPIEEAIEVESFADLAAILERLQAA